MSIIKQLLRVKTMASRMSRYKKKGMRETAYSNEYLNWHESVKKGKASEADRWHKEWSNKYGSKAGDAVPRDRYIKDRPRERYQRGSLALTG